MRRRQREEFGGLNWGAAFFGWLVAVGVATLLTAILSAAGAAIGLTKTSSSQAATARAPSGSSAASCCSSSWPSPTTRAATWPAGWRASTGPGRGSRVWVHRPARHRPARRRGGAARRGVQRALAAEPPRIPVDEGSAHHGRPHRPRRRRRRDPAGRRRRRQGGTHYHRKIDRVGRTRSMTTSSRRRRLECAGRSSTTNDGDKIGTIEEIYLDTDTDQPEWALVKTGLFGGKGTSCRCSRPTRGATRCRFRSRSRTSRTPRTSTPTASSRAPRSGRSTSTTASGTASARSGSGRRRQRRGRPRRATPTPSAATRPARPPTTR